MAFSINLAIATGNVTRDPELKYTPSGMAVCSFGVATNRSIKKGDQWEDVPTFHNIVVWAKQAEYIANSVKKGTLVTVQGRIDNRSYDGKDGTKKYISEIVADSVIPFVEKKVLLPRTPDQIRHDLEETWICENQSDGSLIGCGNLTHFQPDLSEVRGLAVAEKYQGRNIGRHIVQNMIDYLKINRKDRKVLFALTYVPDFFESLGFKIVSKEKFPPKIYEVCQFCLKKDDCHEIAVEYNLKF